MVGIPSVAKQQAILHAAIDAFLRSGYAVSVDEIASTAGVSKQTVYRHFGDKEGLFLSAVAEVRAATAKRSAGDLGDPAGFVVAEPAEMLRRLGEQILAVALSPDVAALHRLTIAEIGNHPQLNLQWSDGAAPFIDGELADYLRHCHDAGTLDLPDPARAARQFAYLLVTEGRTASAYGTKRLTATQRREIASEAADLIVRAYRPS